MSKSNRCNWVGEAQRIWQTIPMRQWKAHIASLTFSEMDKAGIREKLLIAWLGRRSTVVYMGMSADCLCAETDGFLPEVLDKK